MWLYLFLRCTKYKILLFCKDKFVSILNPAYQKVLLLVNILLFCYTSVG